MREYNIRNEVDIKNEFKSNLEELMEIADSHNLTEYSKWKTFEKKAFSQLSNLDEETVFLTKEHLLKNIDNLDSSDKISFDEIVYLEDLEKYIFDPNTNGYNLSYPNNYNNEIIFSAIVNNPSVLMAEMKEFNSKIDQVESKDVNEVLQDLYTAGIEIMIKDVANELELKEEELKVSDLMLIYNKIETDIEHIEPSISKETIEEQIKIEKEIEKQENEREY